MSDPTPSVPVIDFDLGGDAGEEMPVSHMLNLSGAQIRVLAEPNTYLAAKASDGDWYAYLRAFVHPDDWAGFDALLSGARRMDGDRFLKLIAAVTEKPTGHPTAPPSDSSDS